VGSPGSNNGDEQEASRLRVLGDNGGKSRAGELMERDLMRRVESLCPGSETNDTGIELDSADETGAVLGLGLQKTACSK